MRNFSKININQAAKQVFLVQQKFKKLLQNDQLFRCKTFHCEVSQSNLIIASLSIVVV